MVRPLDIHKWPGTPRWLVSILKWQVNILRWQVNILRWQDNILRWQVNTLRWLVSIPRWQVSSPRWLVSTPRWQDSTPKWQDSTLKWQDSTLRWRNKLIRWLNRLIKWDKANSRFIQVGSLFRPLGSPTKCQISQFRWELPIHKPVSRWADTLRQVNLFRWGVIHKVASLKQAIRRWDSHKWDSHKWVAIHKQHNLYLRCSQDSHNLVVNPSNFPTSQLRDSQVSPRGSPFSSLTNLPQASLSLRRRLHHSPRELAAEAITNRRHINSQSEVVRNKECLSQEVVDRKCLCRRSPDMAAAQSRISDVD